MTGAHDGSHREALGLAAAYAVIAAAWIVASDAAVTAIGPTGQDALVLNTAKGIGFVAVTATGLYWLIGIFHRRTAAIDRDAAEVNVRLRLLAERSADIIYRYRVRPTEAYEYISPAVARIVGYPPEAFYADPGLGLRIAHADDLAQLQAAAADPEAGRRPFRFRWLRPDGTVIWIEQHNVPIRDESGQLVAIEGVAREVTAAVEAELRLAMLATAIEQSAESVVITDIEARIQYVNPAFTRVTGYRSGEVLGQNPRILQSGEHTEAFYRAMWDALTNGQTWVADFVNRRKDGSLYQEVAVISPIRDASGTITSYVAVKRDVTREREAEARASGLARERALVASTLANLNQRATPEETAEAICGQITSMTDVALAGLFLFGVEGRADALGFAVASGAPPALRPLPFQRSRILRERAEAGPWLDTWTHRPWHPYDRTMTDRGITSLAYAPVRHGSELIGLLVAAAVHGATPKLMAEYLPAIVEFGELAGALIGPVAMERTAVREVRLRIQAVLSESAFHPVYQPIVDLARGRTVGYEALTRFHDDAPPDVRFGEAAQVGLGIELEVATMVAAIEGASRLPTRGWLDVNASPALILEGTRLREVMGRATQPLVLEVTEHAVIGDYVALRAAVTALGPKSHLAVDDAGAGFASLRHIVELRPDFVKLDRSLVADIDADPARQALVSGLRHFARATHCRLIAEGIETEAELATLRKLEIRLGQGYLLGLPEPAPS